MTNIPHFEQLLENAIALARQVEDVSRRDFVLRVISSSLCKLKRFDEAEKLRKEFHSHAESSDGFCADLNSIAYLVQYGHLEQAKQMARQVKKEHQSYAMTYVAKNLARAGNSDAARELLAELERNIDPDDENEKQYDQTRVTIGIYQLELGWVDEALETAYRCQPKNRHGLLIGAIRCRVLKDGPVAALPLLEKLKECVNDNSFGFMMAMIVGHYAECRYFVEAEKLAQSIREDGNKAKALLNVAKELFAFSCHEEGFRLFSEAEKIIETIEDPCSRANMLCETVGVWKDHDDKTVCDRALALVLATSEANKALPYPSNRTSALMRIAMRLTDCGYFQEAIQIKEMHISPSDFDVIRSYIAFALAHRGRYDEGLSLIDEYEEGIDREERMRTFVGYMLDRGDTEKVWELAERTTIPGEKAILLALLAGDLE